ncbi:MAG: GGDEF domain-containing protein [Candidatus Omnitrophica bacterium]|nr:GGDEF domain-containing protein [Candidatus Omnitrophota bacterium]
MFMGLKVLLISADDRFICKVKNILGEESCTCEAIESDLEILEQQKDTSKIVDVDLDSVKNDIDHWHILKEKYPFPCKLIIAGVNASNILQNNAGRRLIDDYINKDMNIELMRHVFIRNLREYKFEEKALFYEKIIHYDDLSGLHNKRFFNIILKKEIARAVRYKHPLAMGIIDIDNFKEKNDLYGHLIGDQILVKVAKMISLSLRSIDYSFRFGGDEFLALLPNTDFKGAFIAARRLINVIRNIRILGKGEDEPLTMVTVSIGVAEYIGNQTEEEFISQADKALYKVKKNGKDKVFIADESCL